MNNVYVLGDIHGDARCFNKLLHSLKEKKVNVSNTEPITLILLGDAAFNFFLNDSDTQMKKAASILPITYFVVRGNHDYRASNLAATNPQDWHTETFFENDVLVENAFPSIKYAQDEPALYNINGFSTLVLPGAYSVDKWFRIQNHWPWYADEQMNEEEQKKAERIVKNCLNKIDIVLSHTCPTHMLPNDLFMDGLDQNSVDKTTESFLEKIWRMADVKLWLYGHFHQTRVAIDNFYDTNSIMLFNDVALRLDKNAVENGMLKFY